MAQNKGCLKEERMPRPETKDSDWYESMKKEALSIPFTNTFKLPGYARLTPDWYDMKQALVKYNVPILVGVSVRQAWGNSYWYPDHTRISNSDDHGVLLVGWDSSERPIIFDSLSSGEGFDGYHMFAAGYPFYSAYIGLPKLPDESSVVQDQIVENRYKDFEVVVNHYGKPGDWALENVVAYELRRQFENFKNQSVLEAAGKFWIPYVNAISYGNYSYRDVINDCYHWRRTKLHLFNLNKMRV